MKKFKTPFFALLLVLIALCVVLTACGEVYGDWETTVPATCTEKGERRRYLKSDKDQYESEEIPALGHDFGVENDGWSVLEPPSETREGTEMRVCSRCNHKEYRPIDMLQAKSHVDVMDGDKLLYRANADDDGNYTLEEPTKPGYSFEGFIDGNGDEFPASGTIDGNTIVSTVWQILPTTTFAELKERAGAGVDKIYLAADIEITGSIFVVATTQIYVEEDHSLTRSSSFTGDMFVLGETESGDNVLLGTGEPAQLTLTAADNTTLTIDGNKELVSNVNGSAFLLLNSSIMNMYDGVNVVNCKKTGNSKLLSGYSVSYPNKIGGAAMVVVNGTFNMYGGSFTGNEVNLDETNSGDDESENLRDSSCGGAIYNYSTINMYGGSFDGNQAARGGAIYNYRSLNVYEGEFNGNFASVYAGAVYLPGSQYTILTIGKENESNLINFNENSSVKSGGAIFGQMKNSIIIYGGSFSRNVSQESNGGAINTSGALTIKDATFSGNKAASKGGAIYVYYSDSELTVRQVEIAKGVFENNQASKGGAIAFSASSAEFEKGSIGFIGEVTFDGNYAFATESADPELPDQGSDSDDADAGTSEKNFNGNGGAVYISRNSDVTVEGATFTSNSADRNGGAIYVTGSSVVVISNATASENTTDGKGGAMYITDSATVSLTDPDFGKNVSGGNGGAIYCYTGTELTVNGGTFSENKANSTKHGGGALYFTGATGTLNGIELIGNESAFYGGAVSAYSSSVITMTGVNASENKAADRGGAFYLSGSTVTLNTVTLTKNTAVSDTAGAIAVYSGTTLIANGLTATENTAGGYGGVIYVTQAATVKLYDVNATQNSASQGGFIYLTTTDTKVYIYSGSATGNTATKGGSTIWSNTTKAYLYIKGTTTQEFFQYDGIIEGKDGKLTLGDIADEN